MAQPSSRQDLINYVKRQLGAPVLEINVADEQVDDLVDDALQYFHERHFDGVVRTYLKYKITEDDIVRGRSRGSTSTSGITTETVTETVGSSSSFSYEENGNYLPVPSAITGVNKIFRLQSSSATSGSMFSVKYQLFLNDFYNWDSIDLLQYSMVQSKLSDIDYLLNPLKHFRFNQRQDRLYIDMDWGQVAKDDYLIIDCWRLLDPSTFSQVWNDSFLKLYLTALVKRQWGQNLMKFQGVKLPGGVELNGRQMYDDAERELERIREKMSSTYELPPLDMIG
jgi:hypothetical protein|tara:strand:- start:3837 stop:4679 length:843 start_codon:yes stop_codon:yes gene_type:complete